MPSRFPAGSEANVTGWRVGREGLDPSAIARFSTKRERPTSSRIVTKATSICRTGRVRARTVSLANSRVKYDRTTGLTSLKYPFAPRAWRRRPSQIGPRHNGGDISVAPLRLDRPSNSRRQTLMGRRRSSAQPQRIVRWAVVWTARLASVVPAAGGVRLRSRPAM